MSIVFVSLFLFFAVLIEATFFTFPLGVLILLCGFLLTRRVLTYIIFAFVFGILFDLLHVRPIGVTSLFLLIYLFFVSLYQKKFEISALPFVAVSSFIGTWLFSFFAGYSYALILAACSTLLVMVFFIVLILFNTKRSDASYGIIQLKK